MKRFAQRAYLLQVFSKSDFVPFNKCAACQLSADLARPFESKQQQHASLSRRPKTHDDCSAYKYRMEEVASASAVTRSRQPRSTTSAIRRSQEAGQVIRVERASGNGRPRGGSSLAAPNPIGVCPLPADFLRSRGTHASCAPDRRVTPRLSNGSSCRGDADNITFGSTLSNDRLAQRRFDYLIANPPYSKGWKRDGERAVHAERERAAAGRFAPRLPADQ